MSRHCSVRGCYERVAIDERLCSSHAIGMSPAAERALQMAEARTRRGTEPRPRKVVESGPMVPLHVSWRYRYASVTPRMLDWWRRKGWLGPQGEGSGYNYDWDDPSVMFQCRWLAQLSMAGHELTDEDAAAGFMLRGLGAEFAIKLNGIWQAATADEVGWLCTHSQPFTAARVLALAQGSSTGQRGGSPLPSAPVDESCGSSVVTASSAPAHSGAPPGRAAPTSEGVL